MAYRERPGTSGSSRARSRPTHFTAEGPDEGPQSRGVGPTSRYCGTKGPDAKSSQAAAPSHTHAAQRPRADSADEEPSAPAAPRGHSHTNFHIPGESADEDSSSDYVNNTSEEEEYDEGLPEDEEGVTYYIRYCPEDDAYLEGVDGVEEDYGSGNVRLPPDAGRGQEAVEERAEPRGKSAVVERDSVGSRCNSQPKVTRDHCAVAHAHPMSGNAGEDKEEEAETEYCPSKEEEVQQKAPDSWSPHGREGNRNTGHSSSHQGAAVPDKHLDRIVADIKMSMTVSGSDSGSAPEQPAAPYVPRCHEGRPRSLNIPSAQLNHPDPQEGFTVQGRTAEERLQWVQEQLQVASGTEQPSKQRQQRSDLNRPPENSTGPEPTRKNAAFPSFVDVPGPCEPEDLIDGIIFAANYLGSTQLLSERNPPKSVRMMQAQEAVSRVKSPEGDGHSTLTEVDLFISTQRIKVINADTQETMMDNALRTISYIADIGSIVVLMARRRTSQSRSEAAPGTGDAKKQYKMVCHVFESEDAQLIAQSIGQAFSVAYQEFLRANGINPEDLSQKEYSDIINTQEMYNDDLIHFSNSENCKELELEKQKGEILGVVIVESGWGSILPTVILANMMNGGPAARSGKLSIGDQIMSVNKTSLVGLPLATCQSIIKGLKNQTQVKLNIVSCPPVTTVLIKRPDLKYQLGFSVQNGIICSLMRGGIAERGGVRVGHRIIEINGQSAVATAHEKIVQALSNSVGEIHMKTMPAAMFRLLTGQDTPMYI
ncbi:amyloid-beta A4 precursor protein-binding family A member 2-like [Brienomyrus brachyistius]|uniref:amyloid-beta A4 precursor protein-binding family A member 2-like n=1 Tax=Brienomyrus brachyistius TaxID=42636 RepID=UPI0020B27776|nr:amyloid-beta A4 precursor protein-binding family A member 2-like [Brienomyrus brachyistius]XP_048829259.1 amyloid-beta A4 precursor protein-binding family A member 2-like [Brienomyrus brachyistius]